jgi:hypothetical protein
MPVRECRMTDWASDWAALKPDLLALMDGLPSLPADCRAEVEDYAGHNEFGFAFESLCACLEQESVAISAAQYEMIVSLQARITRLIPEEREVNAAALARLIED